MSLIRSAVRPLLGILFAAAGGLSAQADIIKDVALFDHNKNGLIDPDEWPALAKHIEMPPPMVPAPMTPTFLMGSSGVSLGTSGIFVTARSAKKT